MKTKYIKYIILFSLPLMAARCWERDEPKPQKMISSLEGNVRLRTWFNTEYKVKKNVIVSVVGVGNMFVTTVVSDSLGHYKIDSLERGNYNISYLRENFGVYHLNNYYHVGSTATNLLPLVKLSGIRDCDCSGGYFKTNTSIDLHYSIQDNFHFVENYTQNADRYLSFLIDLLEFGELEYYLAIDSMHNLPILYKVYVLFGLDKNFTDLDAIDKEFIEDYKIPSSKIYEAHTRNVTKFKDNDFTISLKEKFRGKGYKGKTIYSKIVMYPYITESHFVFSDMNTPLDQPIFTSTYLNKNGVEVMPNSCPFMVKPIFELKNGFEGIYSFFVD